MDGTMPGIATRKEMWLFFTQKAKWLQVTSSEPTGSPSTSDERRKKGIDPFLLSDPVGIQTQDLQNRNLTLYSAKLRDRCIIADAKVQKKVIREK